MEIAEAAHWFYYKRMQYFFTNKDSDKQMFLFSLE